ncbi:MAG: ABC transporter ATP-binding protein [Rhodoferax sp.]|nr:ABC transporter ATP-binding protein [Rhodoferax sp.]
MNDKRGGEGFAAGPPQGEMRPLGGQRSTRSDKLGGNVILEVRDLHVEFPTAAGPARAVDGVSFTLDKGMRLGLVGESGSGKSTTVLALMQLIKAPGRISAGTAQLAGDDLLAMTAGQIRKARFSRIALVPQGAMNSLNPVLTVRAQINDLLDAHQQKPDAKERARHVASLLQRVGLANTVADQFPHQLSGGMKQRVCIAIAIALSPQLIIADEPTSALDVIVQKQVMQTLIHAQREIGAAIILVGHDMGLMAQFAHVVGVMYAGRLVEIAPVKEIFANPRHPYTRMLISSLPSFTTRKVFRGIPGVAPSIVNPPSGCAFHPRCPRAEAICAREVPIDDVISAGHHVCCHFARELAPTVNLGAALA